MSLAIGGVHRHCIFVVYAIHGELLVGDGRREPH